MYPAIVMVIAIVIMGFLLVFIVPKFEQIFADMLGGKPLPLLTQIVIGASRGIKDNIIFLVLGIGGIVGAVKYTASTPKGSVLIDQFMLKAPLFGDLTRKNGISRFTRTLGTLVTSGVPILQALNITKETAGNAVISSAIIKIHDSVKEGESIVRPMDASGVFPPMVISMVDVGEETGQLPEMLLKVADLYDDEVDSSVAGLTSMMEPIMIVFLAVVVGSIVIALFLPLIGIISGMQQ
jgi:type IV pilus assembly protein PilC